MLSIYFWDEKNHSRNSSFWVAWDFKVKMHTCHPWWWLLVGGNIPRYIFTYQLSFCCRLPHEYIRSMVLTFGLAFGSSEELKNHRMEYNISGTVTPLDSWCYANQFKIAKVMSTHKKKRFGKGYMLFWCPNLSLTPSSFSHYDNKRHSHIKLLVRGFNPIEKYHCSQIGSFLQVGVNIFCLKPPARLRC